MLGGNIAWEYFEGHFFFISLQMQHGRIIIQSNVYRSCVHNI